MNGIHLEEKIPSDSVPGRYYNVVVVLSCNCSGFTLHGKCKHVRRRVHQVLEGKRSRECDCCGAGITGRMSKCRPCAATAVREWKAGKK